MDLEYALSHWEHIRAGLVETINKFRDEELDFKPFEKSWSVREMMLHIAQEENGEFNYGITQTLKEFPAEYKAEEYATRASIQALLSSVHAQSIEYLRTLDDDTLWRVVKTPWGASYRLIEMVDHIVEHETSHRGELSLILGILGREGLNA